MNLTPAEHKAMAYVVPDPDVWIAHVETTFPTKEAQKRQSLRRLSSARSL